MLARMILQSLRVRRRLKMRLLQGHCAGHGRRLWFVPAGQSSLKNIRVGDDMNLGICPTLVAGEAEISIGNHVVWAPKC